MRKNGMYFCEIVRVFDGTYYANLYYNNVYVPLKEYVSYRELRKDAKEKGYDMFPNLSELNFERYGKKEYAYISGGAICM